MSIEITEKGVEYINTTLISALSYYEVTPTQTKLEVIEPLIKEIQASRRWVEVGKEAVEELAASYNVTLPEEEENYRVNIGKILVECRGGIYRREYYSDCDVLKGWHREVIDTIKRRQNMVFNKEIGELIFNVGQHIISNHLGEYIRTVNLDITA